MLNCFFGLELLGNGPKQSPPVPQRSVLVVTQVAITFESYKSAPRRELDGVQLTLCAQSSKTSGPMALCTLCPSAGIFHEPLRQIFSSSVTFNLVQTSQKASGDVSTAPALSVHLTGYYESSCESPSESSESNDDN